MEIGPAKSPWWNTIQYITFPSLSFLVVEILLMQHSLSPFSLPQMRSWALSSRLNHIYTPPTLWWANTHTLALSHSQHQAYEHKSADLKFTQIDQFSLGGRKTRLRIDQLQPSEWLMEPIEKTLSTERWERRPEWPQILSLSIFLSSPSGKICSLHTRKHSPFVHAECWNQRPSNGMWNHPTVLKLTLFRLRAWILTC